MDYFTYTADHGADGGIEQTTIPAEHIADAAKKAYDAYGGAIDEVRWATATERDAEIARHEAQMRAAFS